MHGSGGTDVACRDHVVCFYEHDTELVVEVGAYLLAAVENGDVGIAVATEAHRLGIVAVLRGAGVDVDAAVAAGSLVLLDAAETLAYFVVDGRPDPACFDAVVGEVVRAAGSSGRRVRAYGEMVALLWEEGQVPAAIELEALWNTLIADVGFTLFCAYPSASLDGSPPDTFAQVCGLHSQVVSAVVTGGPGTATRFFAADVTSPRNARHFVVDALRAAVLDRLAPDVAVVVGELAANVVLHARSGFTVTVEPSVDSIRIAVRDDDPFCPSPLTPSAHAVTGRGLALVDALAAGWGAQPAPGGKVVWALVAG